MRTAEFYAGLLPHPDHLERFEAILPGITNRLLTVIEGQSVHRQAMERKFLNFNGSSQILGVVFGGLFLLSAVAGGVFLLYTGRRIEGFATMLGAIAAVAIAFIRQRHQQLTESSEKAYRRLRAQ